MARCRAVRAGRLEHWPLECGDHRINDCSPRRLNWHRTTNGELVSDAAVGLNVLLGLWVLAFPFVFFDVELSAAWNDVIVGGSIALFAGYNTYKEFTSPERSPEGAEVDA